LKVQFLEEIRAIRLAFQGTWAIAGDFNLILDAADKNNAMLNRRMMGRFRRLLNDLELKEQPLVGRRYTWSNERQAPTLGKLDRWFATVEWDMSHPDCLLQALSSSMSDHCPIMLSTNVSMNRKSRFHF
jgi:endonuclease/exonuclease/phosphatase family metal-dependent hydrolase